MELRRRKGELVENAEGRIEKTALRVDAEASENMSNDLIRRRINDDGGDSVPSSSEAADAVVGAAVRGGSLLMLLALIQRASTFVLNVLLQRAMLSGVPTTTTPAAGKDDARATSALEEYGAAAVTLELISSTALFLAREPFRVALARSRAPPGEAVGGVGTEGEEVERRRRRRREAYRRRFVNTAWLSAPVGLTFAAVVRLAYPWVIRNDAFDGIADNRQAATLVCIAAAMELMCEPLALIFQYRLLVAVRVRAEAAAVLVLGVSRFLLVTRGGMGVLSFGYAQLLHSATLALAYLWFAARDVAAGSTPTDPNGPSQRGKSPTAGDDRGFERARGWLPSRPLPLPMPLSEARKGEVGEDSDEWVDSGQIRLAGALAGQSLLKHVLTEGDKIVLARATSLERGGGDGGGGGSGGGGSRRGSLYEQGVYAIASGYGSLAARLLFQPLEEAARLMFSKLGAEEGDADKDGVGGSGDGRRLRERMAALLATLLKLVLTAGLVFVCFGFHYTETLLRLLLAGRGGGEGGGSSAVSEVARVLSWYCVYVLFLAANGMCEAFACAVARGSQLTGMGAGLVASFVAFWALVAPLTSRFGTRGLVMANAAGMACRVACSAAFIRRFFLRQTPSGDGRRAAAATVAATVVAAVAEPPETRNGEENLWRAVVKGALPHPYVGAVMAMSSVAVHAASPAVRRGGGLGDSGATGGLSWNAVAALEHVAVGVACLAVSGCVFFRKEGKFLRDLRGLWAARRRKGEGVATASKKVGVVGAAVGGAVSGRGKVD